MIDRSFIKASDGVYRSTATVPHGGTYEFIFTTGIRGLTSCLAFEVKGASRTVQQKEVSLVPLDIDGGYHSGQTTSLKLKIWDGKNPVLQDQQIKLRVSSLDYGLRLMTTGRIGPDGVTAQIVFPAPGDYVIEALDLPPGYSLRGVPSNSGHALMPVARSQLFVFCLFALLIAGQTKAAQADKILLKMEAIEIPDVSLTDQDGNIISFVDDLAKDHRLVINFQFTGCLQQCPVTTAIMAGLDGLTRQDQRYSDVRLISITLDPLSDTVEQLSAKASEVGAGPRWRWLTGGLDDLDAIYRRLGVSPGPKEDHDAFFLVGEGNTGKFIRVSGVASPAELLAQVEKIVP